MRGQRDERGSKSGKSEGKSGEGKVRSAANRGKLLTFHISRGLIEDFVAAREAV